MIKFQRMENGWALLKASWEVLSKDRKLVMFPIISMMSVILVTLTFTFPIVQTGLIHHIAAGDKDSMILGGILLFILYIINYTLIFYCNTALVSAALIHFHGGTPSISDGFQYANRHLRAIVIYAMIASTVGIFLQFLKERGIVGEFISAFMGAAWNVASFLVIPILVIEKVGPIDALKRSISLIKTTWREYLGGEFGFGLIFFLLFALTFISGIYVVIASFQISSFLGFSALVVALLALFGLHLIGSALQSIYATAVYLYTTTGTTNNYFSENLIQKAFKDK